MQPAHGSSGLVDGISAFFHASLCAYRAGIKPGKQLCAQVPSFAYSFMQSYWDFTFLLLDRVKLS